MNYGLARISGKSCRTKALHFMRSHPVSFAILLSAVLAVAGTSSAADNIALKINGGTVRQMKAPPSGGTYQATLYWEPDGGTPVVLDDSGRSSKHDMHWTLSAGYFEGNKIALWRG